MTEQDDKYADLLDYNWNHDSLQNRMLLSQRAKIFLPLLHSPALKKLLKIHYVPK